MPQPQASKPILISNIKVPGLKCLKLKKIFFCNFSSLLTFFETQKTFSNK